MLQIKDLHYSIGDRQLLAGMDWTIQDKKRAALIGPNGTGKTTLLKILTGEIEPTQGRVSKPKDYRIGYLPQEEIDVGSGTLLESVLAGQTEIADLEKRINELHHALDSTTAEQENLLKQLGDLEQRFEAVDGYHIETTAKNILTGLGFRKSDFDRPLREFSGGWRMRSYLALLLTQKPDLLLLDEPTNHLDLPSLEWLEQYLLNFPGSIILVSHDRFFIDRLAQEIVELEGGKLEHYSGNYHFFKEQKKQRQRLLEKKWKEQQSEIARQERFINRFRAKNTKATQVQSRIKQLERMEKIELTPPSTSPHLEFKLNVSVRSFKDTLQIKDMWFRYDKQWIFRDINLSIYRGERVALIGANGTGKTTLTRLIAGQLQPQAGSLQTGERAQIGYYAQHQAESLNLEATVYQEVSATAATSYLTEIRNVLGLFQFSGDDVNKKISVLSGGEKARVSLAKILLSPVNFLIMDEPTNHLDRTAREALEHALSHYDGTMLLISHDRYFLDKLVERVIEFREGELEEYSGDYSYYLQKRRNREEPAHSNLPGEVSRPGGIKKTKEQKRLEAEARQAVSKELNQLKNEIERLEDRISHLETRIAEIETDMASPDTYQDKRLTVSLQKEYAAAKKELDESNKKWEDAQLKYEDIKSRLL
ncbi:MAG: ATP-binding cassette domain-containing protein [Candidatus Aminicenantes bacterium]|nr:ATP-binding cassette domain-containing protein [Candidatus Aminicenantes bacterium]